MKKKTAKKEPVRNFPKTRKTKNPGCDFEKAMENYKWTVDIFKEFGHLFMDHGIICKINRADVAFIINGETYIVSFLDEDCKKIIKKILKRVIDE
jgi:hypothetical protein